MATARLFSLDVSVVSTINRGGDNSLKLGSIKHIFHLLKNYTLPNNNTSEDMENVLPPQCRHSNVEYFTSRTAGAAIMRPPDQDGYILQKSGISKAEFFRPHTTGAKLPRGYTCLPKIDLGMPDGSEVPEPKPWEKIDIRKMGIINCFGDKKGKKCKLFFYGGRLPFTHETDHSQILKYMKEFLERYQKVFFVYFHHGVTRDQQVPIPVLLEGLSELSEMYSSKIIRIYMVQMDLPQIAINPILALVRRRFPTSELCFCDYLAGCPRWLKKYTTQQMISCDKEKEKMQKSRKNSKKVSPMRQSNPVPPPSEPAPVKQETHTPPSSQPTNSVDVPQELYCAPANKSHRPSNPFPPTPTFDIPGTVPAK